jgi:dTDP-4-amino-4,6-dideoxygalactose transaminase
VREKALVEDLALFGGEPAFSNPIHVGRPNIGNRDRLLEKIDEILDRGWLTNKGPNVIELENRIADLAGVKHCIAICNGTVALEIAISTAGLSGEVILPSFTFIATAHALQWQQIKPVFCDIDPETHNIDVGQVEKLITPRTTGIIGVHLWGRPCDIEALDEIASRHQLKLLFDAAHAFGCSYRGRMIGNFGLAEVFSFHATKFFNTCEGGAVVTNDDDLAEEIRLARNFGFAGYDNVIRVGTNGKLNEFSAAMGLVGLESVEETISRNRSNYHHYINDLDGVQGIELLTYDEQERCNYQYVVAETDKALTGIDRDLFIDILHAENILARRYFYPGCHLGEPYRSLYGDLKLPETDTVSGRVISLPTGVSLGENEIGQVCQIIRFAIENASEICKRREGTNQA